MKGGKRFAKLLQYSFRGNNKQRGPALESSSAGRAPDAGVGAPSGSGSAAANSDAHEKREFTQNDANELLDSIQHAIAETRNNMLIGRYHASAKLGPLIDQLNYKVPTLTSTLLPPFIKRALGDSLAPIRDEAEALQDKYFPVLLADIDMARVDRIPSLIWLSYLNQMRLKYAKEPVFTALRGYIQDHYFEDLADPAGHTGMVPERAPDTEDIWKQIDYLEARGHVVVREVINWVIPHDKDEPPHPVAIITMSDPETIR